MGMRTAYLFQGENGSKKHSVYFDVLLSSETESERIISTRNAAHLARARAQATAARRSSSYGSPSPSMQLRRAVLAGPP